MTPHAIRTAQRGDRTGPILTATLTGGFAAAVLTASVYGMARLTGCDLLVTTPGGTRGTVPLTAVVGACATAAAAGGVLAALVAGRPRGRRIHLVVTTAVLAVSFVPPFEAADTVSTALWLSLMHLTAAAGIVLPAARALGGTNRWNP